MINEHPVCTPFFTLKSIQILRSTTTKAEMMSLFTNMGMSVVHL